MPSRRAALQADADADVAIVGGGLTGLCTAYYLKTAQSDLRIDWCTTVGLNKSTGLGWAGGYVGHGVAATNLAGRTLADLVLGRDTDFVNLPWVGRQVRQWEPEPARWLAVRGLYAAYHAADRRERASQTERRSLIAKAADLITGR